MSGKHSIFSDPPPEVVQAATRLNEGCDSLCQGITGTSEAWAARVNDAVVGPLAAKLADIEKRHQAELRVFRRQLEAADGKDRANECWRAAEEYVRQVHVNCIEPILAYLEESDPLTALEAQLLTTEEQLMGLADRLPELTEVPFTEDLVKPDPGDAFRVRTAKSWQRRRRSSRVTFRRLGNSLASLWGRGAVSLPYEGRSVRARQAAQVRLSHDVVPALRYALQPLLSSVEHRLRELERSIWKWTQEGLRFLTDQDHPRFHVPETLTLKWPHERRAGTTDLPSPQFMDLLQFIPGEFPRLEAPDLSDAIQRVERDLKVSGTFLYQGIPALRPGLGTRVSSAGFTRDRVRLADGLLDLWRDIRIVEERLLLEVADQTLVPLERTYASIREHILDTKARALELVSEGVPLDRRKSDALRKGLEGLLDQSGSIDALYRDLSGLSAADNALTDPGQSTWRSLMKRIAALPAHLELRGSVGENPRTFRSDLRHVVRQAFERPTSERLSPAAEPLRRTIARVWNQTEQVSEVVANTFHTALQHISAPRSGETDLEDDGDVRELISGGLDRACDSLAERYQSIGPDWAQFVSQLHRIFDDDWNSAFRALQSDDFLAKRLLGVQTLIARRAEKAWQGLTAWVTSVAESGRATFRLLRSRARDVIRIGQTAVGVGSASREERHQALDTVRSARALYAKLPLVYRRLFSVEPVTDAGLAENRVDDIGAVRQALDRWSDGRGAGVLVIHGPLGSGRTTFLRLLDLEIWERLTTVRLGIDRRMTGESQLAAHLAGALFPDDTFEGDLEALEEAIGQRVEPRSTVVLVDNLEMVLFQSPGGTDLLNRLLLFWIRTDDRVAWCASASTLAWRFAKKTASGASRLPILHELTPWSSQSVREMVLKRHRRTGISLEFAPPKDPSPIIRQRLKRARSEQEVQKILASEFFDALFKISGQSPTRALFEWVRAGTFSEDGTLLSLDPIQPISFGYLQQFENDIAFAMRSFMIHNTLTVEEYARLFRSSQAESLMAFETLLSAGLIEALDPSERAAIEPGVRYRLRRLVLEPVVRSLQERHFVY